MRLRIAMAQTNPTVGDLEGNTELIREYSRRAVHAQADIVAFPEMAITGYPPLDLLPPRETRTPVSVRRLEQEEFVRLNKQCILDLARDVRGITAVVGFVDYDDRNLYNAAAVISGDRVVSIVHKTLLPTYDVFDELRYFTPGEVNNPVDVDINGQRIRLGVSICEDIWDEEIGYGVKVVDGLCQKGAQLILNLNASPFHDKKRYSRLEIMRGKVRKLRVPVFYVNMIGGQDELVFDGESLAMDADGHLLAVGKQFQEELVTADVDLASGIGSGAAVAEPVYDRDGVKVYKVDAP